MYSHVFILSHMIRAIRLLFRIQKNNKKTLFFKCTARVYTCISFHISINQRDPESNFLNLATGSMTHLAAHGVQYKQSPIRRGMHSFTIAYAPIRCTRVFVFMSVVSDEEKLCKSLDIAVVLCSTSSTGRRCRGRERSKAWSVKKRMGSGTMAVSSWRMTKEARWDAGACFTWARAS